MRYNFYNEDDPVLTTKKFTPLTFSLSLLDCLKLCI